jgi:hypothetical protein
MGGEASIEFTLLAILVLISWSSDYGRVLPIRNGPSHFSSKFMRHFKTAMVLGT